MSIDFDLHVDTVWIRSAATTLDEAARTYLSGPDHRSGPPIGPGHLGESVEDSSVAALINLRCDQAQQAAAQLGSVSTGLADKLVAAAEAFDRSETTTRSGPK